MNRRKFLAMIAAGGVVTAAGIWMPGQKLISIPKKRGLAYLVTRETIGENLFGYYPKTIWPGIERWFYDKYNEELSREWISAKEFYLSDNVAKT